MLKFKPGIDVYSIKPEIVLLIQIVYDCWKYLYEHGYDYDCVITSVIDGKHSATSLHNIGYAVDFRTRELTKDQQHMLVELIHECLGESPDYDLVLEETHLHIEYQRKTKDNK